MSKLVITFICENGHDVETVTVDLARREEVTKEEVWRMLTRDCCCKKCGSDRFIYRTRYKG
ncbi:MAG: hypothetical protein A4E55_01313 [Pelotomaculum sp. PtaU1.Bin035]|nr:MAG: hypothetical protein A4E55_01313 [Pelotomaculum sp. PtaU1.Bin035]